MSNSPESNPVILIVDNDEIVYYLIQEILLEEGYSTIHVEKGKEALQITKNQKIDLILLDIMMPGMNGFEVCSNLQADPASAHIPIIFLSAKDDEESYKKGFELGAIDYLTKPISQLDLVLKIRNYLNLSQKEQMLKESELRYRMLADYNYDWEYWLGDDGKFLYVSPSCERITGYKDEEFIKDPNLIFTITHPDHLDLVSKHYKTIRNNKRVTEILEYKIIARNGEEKWINHVCSPVFDNNNVFNGFRGNYRDITSKKIMEVTLAESEKKFRNIFQSNSDSIVITDYEYRILESNNVFQKTVGIDSTKLEQLKITNFVHPNDVEKFKNWFHDISKSEILSRHAEFRFLIPNKEIIFMEINSKIMNYHGDLAILSILRDVTERKEVQYRILNTIIETEEKERRRFAQDIHDGMGPLLSTIKLYTRSVLTAKDDKNKAIALQKSLDTIDEAISHVKEIAFNISPSILKDFGLGVAIKSYVNKFNDTQKVKINFPSEINQRFETNIEASLFRIIIELINNTVKHSFANNAFIKLIYFKNILTLNYSDDGIGFELNPILEKSTGQGLFNIINRTKSIGGEINIETELNKGFKVSISIPLKERKKL